MSKVGFTPQGWNFWAHGFGIEPYEGPASVMAPVGQRHCRRRREGRRRSTSSRPRFSAEMDEGKRKELFDQFQKHMYDDAVVMKAGNYGHVPGRDASS